MIKHNALLVVGITLLAGCSTLQQVGSALDNMAANQRATAYASVEDKVLVDAFYVLTPEGAEQLTPTVTASNFEPYKLTANQLVMRRKELSASNMGEMHSLMARLSNDAESDGASVTFINNARSRGNEVRVYRPAMTAALNRLFAQPIKPLPQSAEWYDRDVSLVEYDPQGRPVALLLRAYQAQTSIGVNAYQYVQAITGAAPMRHFENNVSNRMLEDNQLRVLR